MKSIPRILRIAAIKKLTTISLGLIPFLVSNIGKAEVGNSTEQIEARESVTDAIGEKRQPAIGTQAGWQTEVEAFNQIIAAFNRDVVDLRDLESEINGLTDPNSPKKDLPEHFVHDERSNAFVIQKNARINDYNKGARILNERKAAIERYRTGLEECHRALLMTGS
jgi:hypothetical protein